MKPKSVLIAWILAAMVAAAVDWNAEGQRWWSHIQYLASDELEGRNTGSEGHRKAAAYVAQQFERDAFKPAGTDGYFQPIEFNVRQIDEPHSRLDLIRGERVQPVRLGEDAMFSMRVDAAESLKAPAVFVGYGLSIPEAKHDDLSGLDLRGKIAVYISGGPASIAGPLKAHYQSGGERWKALAKAGAVGTAMIFNPRAMDIPWPRAALSRFQPAMDLADPALQETRGAKFSLLINPERADKFFEGTSHTMAEILAAMDADKPLPRFPLAAAFRAHVVVERSRVISQNVIALLPGSAPKLKDEYVVFTAHLDHVGVGMPINGDSIYNGAMDDASGVATLLEVARALKDTKPALKRSLLFVVVTGEEKGLLGSKYFTNHPTVNGKNIVADINVDMFLPLHPLHYLEVQGVGESTLGDDIRAVAQAAGVEVQSDKEPNRNLFIRSDQYSFIRKGIPALAFKFGYLPGSPEERLHKEWLKNRYHAPSDDTNQPVDLAAAAQFNHILLKLAERVANEPTRPQWKPSSFFRRFAMYPAPLRHGVNEQIAFARLDDAEEAPVGRKLEVAKGEPMERRLQVRLGDGGGASWLGAR